MSDGMYVRCRNVRSFSFPVGQLMGCTAVVMAPISPKVQPWAQREGGASHWPKQKAAPLPPPALTRALGNGLPVSCLFTGGVSFS